MYKSSGLRFAYGAKSIKALLCDLGRYSLCIQPVPRICSHNIYRLESVVRAYLLGALQQPFIPTGFLSEMFCRIGQAALEFACYNFQVREIDILMFIFLNLATDADLLASV